jgi:hypothetical protein
MDTRRAVARVHIQRRGEKALRAVLVLSLAALAACNTRHAGAAQDDVVGIAVVAIDRTGVAQDETWATEVAAQVMHEVERALDDGVERVEIIGIGSTAEATVRWATVDLTDVRGNTRSKREVARQQLVAATGAAARELAEQPVATQGTDVVVALDQAVALCRAPDVGSCSILLASDLEDQRVTGAPSAAAAVEVLAPLMPELDGIPVSVTGLGASGAGSTVVAQVHDAWEALLRGAGAGDVRIARSL